MSVGSRIRHLRCAFDLTQRDLAAMLSTRQATISAWERDEMNVTDGNLRLLSDLAREDRAVFAWLKNGGQRPPLERHPGPTAAERRESSGPREAAQKESADLPDQLMEDITHTRDRQALTLRLLEEIEARLTEDLAHERPLVIALQSARRAAETSCETLEGIRSSLNG